MGTLLWLIAAVLVIAGIDYGRHQPGHIQARPARLLIDLDMCGELQLQHPSR